MEAFKSYEALCKHLNQYINSLDLYSEEAFARQPDAESWSLAHVYEHIATTLEYFFFNNAKDCLNKENGSEEGTPSEIFNAILEVGAFPPQKIKGPVKTSDLRIQSREAYGERLDRLQPLAKEILDRIQRAENFDYKVSYPGFGALNALQWFQLAEMHTRHHLRQIKDIEHFLINEKLHEAHI